MSEPSEELSELARRACHQIEQRSDDHDVRMHGIILFFLEQATAKLREELKSHE